MKKILIILFIFLFSATVFAEEKKGFMLNLGFGLGSTTTEYTDGATSLEYEYESVYLDAKLGLGFGKLFLFGNYKIIAYDYTPDDSEDDEVRGFTITGFGASYFIDRLYITGTIGAAQYRAFASAVETSDETAKEFEGGAVYIGAGIEIIPQILLEIGAYGGGLTSETASYDQNFNGVVVSANLLFY